MYERRNLANIVLNCSLLMILVLALTVSGLAQDASPVTAEAADQTDGLKIEPPEEKDSPESGNLITATTYAFAALSGVPLENMSTGTTQLVGPSLDDTASAVTNIGFDFWFDGVRHTQFSCNANGLCRLGSTVVTTTFANSLATVTAAPKITPYWDDLCTGSDGKVHFKVVGSPGSRKLIVEWQNVKITRNGTCVGAVGNGTFQLWIFETTGVVQSVYGELPASAAADTGYSIGLQAGVATNFASVTTTPPSVSYTAANNAQTNAIPAGTSYTFTPNVPAAPSAMNFTAVGTRTITVNWTDNATNELAYQIFRSTDGINFTQLADLPANAVTYTDNFLTNTTTYTYRVIAISEGALSASLTGSQATITPTPVSANAAGGNWSSPATWAGGVVPNANNNVTIPSGATITVDTAGEAHNLTISSGAVVQFESATARSLTVAFQLNVAGTLQSSPSGTVTDHTLNLGSDTTVTGMIDLSTNGDTAGANLVLAGAGPSGLTGSGSVDVRAITVNTATAASVWNLAPAAFTVRGSTTDNANAGFLTVTQGVFQIGGTFTANMRTFASATFTIPATGGFRLNNPNYTVTAQTGSATVNGNFQVQQGNFNFGTAINDSLAFGSNSSARVDGGVVNVAGRFGVGVTANIIDYRQTAGTVTVSTAGNNSTTLASFDMGTSTLSFVSITGGSIVVQNANTAAATPRDYRLQSGSAATSNGTASVTGGTVQFGNAATIGAQTFNGAGVFPFLTIDTTGGLHTFNMLAPVTWNNITRNVTIPSGATFNIGNFVYLFNGVNFVNNGAYTGTGAASNFVPFDPAGNVVVSGSGVWTGVTTAIGMQAASLTLNQINQIRVRNLRVFTGNVINANKITLGNNDATVSVIQFGNTTTPTLAGVLDSAPTFELGAGGQTVTYLRTGNARTTGPEINPARTLVAMTYDNNDPLTNTLTIAGGNLTIGAAMTLANGVIQAGSNTITHNGAVTRTNGFIVGTLNRSYTAGGSYIYHVGANGYSPVTASIATVTTVPSSLSVRPTDDFLPGVAQGTGVSRFWTLTEVGDLTASFSLTYLDADINGDEAMYKVFRRAGGVTAEVAPSTPNPATNSISVTGITDFSDWGIGTSLAPTQAFASISGRATREDGYGLPRVTVVLSNSQGVVQTALTNGFGYYSFGNIATGVNYTVSVSAKAYTFNPSSRQVTLNADVGDVDFSGTSSLSRSGTPKKE